MIEGVLVDQLEARRAYEARVRQDIDPGLGEVCAAIQFRDPGLPDRCRARAAPSGSASSRRWTRARAMCCRSPARHEIGELAITVEASGLSREPGGRGFRTAGKPWRSGAAGPIASLMPAPGSAFGGSLTISGIERAAPAARVDAVRTATLFRALRLRRGRGTRRQAAQRRRCSGTGRCPAADDGLAAEAALLRAYLERVRPDRIELIFFDSGLVERVTVADPEAAAAAVAAIRYRGATSYAPLVAAGDRGRACLLFTDGLVTIDRRDSSGPPARSSPCRAPPTPTGRG